MKRAYTSLLILLVLAYCNPKEQEALQPLDSNIRFLLFPESDSVFLASAIENQLVAEKSAWRVPTAGYYLSEDTKLLFSMERTDGEINIMPLDKFGQWLPQPIERPQPTHWTGVGFQSLVFNDGDGSVLHVKTDPATTQGFVLGVITVPGSVAHHGAALYLGDHLLAMTIKSEAEEGTLPKRLALVDTKTQEVLMTTDETTVGGIHGAQSNGSYALFGSMDGILWVKKDQTFGLISYPSPLENTSGNWIGTIKGAGDAFIGSARNLGLFKIDPENQSIAALYLSDDIADYHVSPDGDYTLLVTKDNRLVVLDNTTLKPVKEVPIPNQPETIKGFKVSIADGRIFLAALGYQEIQVLDIKSLQVLSRLNTVQPLMDFMVVIP